MSGRCIQFGCQPVHFFYVSPHHGLGHTGVPIGHGQGYYAAFFVFFNVGGLFQLLAGVLVIIFAVMGQQVVPPDEVVLHSPAAEHLNIKCAGRFYSQQAGCIQTHAA